jgi:GNAT superfamily N-acetyltransferase
MTSQGISIPINTDIHIRRLDPVHDMPEVLNLIELGFQTELDPQGWKMLKQMRQVYKSGKVAQSLYGPTTDTTGFVWEQDGHIVGNLSLRHASPRGSHGRLVGNVVVHPEYQGQGIGRALMEKAIASARDQGASWVGLEVRANNAVAHKLYEHLGFRVTGTTEHLIRPSGLRWPDSAPPDRKWRRATSGHSEDWKRLATLNFTNHQRLILEIRESIYEYGGLERRLNLWFSRKHEKAWIHDDGTGSVDLAAHIEVEKRYRFHTWDMLMDPDSGPPAARELVTRCLAGTRGFPAWPVIAIVPDHDVLVAALRHVGFQPHRALQQMILEF